jgi:hypothetical protein
MLEPPRQHHVEDPSMDYCSWMHIFMRGIFVCEAVCESVEHIHAVVDDEGGIIFAGC